MNQVIIVCESNPKSDTYHIKNLLKANGFEWARKAKRWFTDLDRKAEAMQLLETCNLSNDYHFEEMTRESLFNSFSTFNLQQDTIGLSEVTKKAKVSSKKVRKLIAENKIKEILFELDSLGRKINRRLDRKDVKRELGI
jgi:hypothetical protein